MGKPKYLEKNLLNFHFVYNKSHFTTLEFNTGLHSEKPVTDCLMYGMVLAFGCFQHPKYYFVAECHFGSYVQSLLNGALSNTVLL